MSCLSLFLALNASAETLKSRINNLIQPEKSGESILVFADSGEVLSVAPENTAIVNALNESFTAGNAVEFSFGEDRIVDDVRVLPAEEEVTIPSMDEMAPESFGVLRNDSIYENYPATELSSMSAASNVFYTLHGNLRQRSQCYWRAHVWAYDMYARQGIRSMKVYLFFTPRYIREYGYKWWFHVSPFVYVGGKEVVLDRTFTGQPMSMKSWTDQFMYNNANCRTISRFSQGEYNRNYSDYCVLRKVPMYHWQPADVEAADMSGAVRSGFNMWEVRTSKRKSGANIRRP